MLIADEMFVKVWPKDEIEPQRWDVINKDSAFTKGGISFFFRSSQGSANTILIDNVKVMGWSEVAALTDLINQAQALAESDYTTESWEVLQTALATALQTREDTGATPENIDMAIQDLQSAIAGLQLRTAQPTAAVLSVDGSVKLVSQGINLTVGVEGISSSFTTLDVVVNYDPEKLEFETQLNSKNTLSLADSAISSLLPNFNVVGTAIKPELGQIYVIMSSSSGQHAINEDSLLFTLHGRVKDDAAVGSTSVSLTDYGLSMSGTGMSVDVSQALLNIDIIRSDKAGLGTAINSAQNLHDAATEGTQPGQYPAGSKAALQAAINDAMSVNNNVDATQSEVDAAINALAAARSTFVNAVNPSTPTDKSALVAAIAAAQSRHDRAMEGNTIGQYAPGAKATLQAAITAAISVNTNAGSSQSEVNQAVATLNNAVGVFSATFVTLVEGQTKVTIRDLSLIAQYFRSYFR